MDLLVSLLLIPFALPMVLGFVTMCCCGANNCDSICSPGTRPTQLQITIAGLTNGSCSSCSAYNKTYTLAIESPPENITLRCSSAPAAPAAPLCAYRVSGFMPTDCEPLHVKDLCCEIYASGGVVALVVALYLAGSGGVKYVEWRQDDAGLGSPAGDCSAISSLDAPYLQQTSTPQCDGSSSTCTVTAI